MIIYIAILIIIGMLLLVLEILILPGLIAGIIGGLFILAALTWTFKEYGTTIGIYTTVATLLITGFALYMAFRSKLWNRFSLKEDLHLSKVNVVDTALVKEGDEAITASALRPMGTVMINDLKIEAQTNGELIPENTVVIIQKIENYKVLVKRKA